MKKSLSVILSSAMALSMFSSVAFGATTKTSADFTDLKDLPADQKAIFDSMISQGIFDGVTDTTFGLNDDMNRAQFAKIAAKILGLDATGTVSSFTDVKASDAANGYAVGAIESLKKAGVTDGVTDTTFDPAGKVTKEQLAAFIIRALGKDAEAKLTPAVNDDTVSTWAKGYVAFALGAKLITNDASGKFGGTTNAKRSLLVNASFAAKTAIDASKATSIASVTATGAKKITVTFNKAVDSTKAVIDVKNGSNAVNASTTVFADDKKSVTLTYPNNLAAADYTVSVTGLSTEAITGKVTVAAEKVTKISFNNENAVIVRNPAANTSSVQVNYKVYNQYSEDVTSSYWSALTFTAGKGTFNGTASSSGVAQFDVASTSPFNNGDKVNVSVIHAATGVFASQVATVSAIAQADTVTLVKVLNPSTTTEVLAANSTAGSFSLLIQAKDQYGNAVKAANFAADTLLTVADTSIFNVLGGSSTPTYSDQTIDGTAYIALPLTNGTGGVLKAGTTNVTLMSRTTGKISVLAVTVKDVNKADTVTLSAPSLAVADEKVNIPFTAVDQFGAALTTASTLNGATISTTLDTAGSPKASFVQDYVKNTANLVLDLTGQTTAQNVVITIVTPTGKISSLNVSVVAKATPTVITGLTTDIKKSLLVGGTQTVAAGYVKVQDQYGRLITPTLSNTATTYHINVTSGTTANVAVTGGTFLDGTTTIALSGVAKGSSSITLELAKGDGTPIANSSYVWTENVVDKAAISSFQLADIAKLYKGTASDPLYKKAVTVNGVLADGSLVTIPSNPANYTVSSSVYDSTSGMLDGFLAAAPASGTTDGTASVAVTVIGANGASVLTKDVSYSTAAPKPATYTLQTKGNATLEADGVISANTSVTNLKSQGNIEALVLDAIKTVDQYGVELTGGVVLVADTPALAITREYGSVTVTNISNSHTISQIVSGDTFYVTVISPDYSKTLTFKVIVK